jgi:predicted AAA+ superfamily ATPase
MYQRYLFSYLKSDLKKKMVFLSGPRQSGKTTLAKSILPVSGLYLNYDIAKHRKLIRNQDFDSNCPIVILDELHKMAKWKNYLKGLYDERGDCQKYLVTGSARLETFRKQGDALTGRYFSHHLHPMCPTELCREGIAKGPQQAIEMLLKLGGFPESFVNPKEAPRLREERFQSVVREDLRDMTRVIALRQFEVLIEILRERSSGQLSYKSLEEDLSVSSPTVMSWVDWLSRLYTIFLIYPWSTATSRSLKKMPKFYFYDCAANEKEESRLENLVASALIKHCDFMNDTQGEKFELKYFRDKENREVDFVLLNRKKPIYFIEVKSSDSTLSSSLLYLAKRNPKVKAVQLVNSPIRSKTIHGCEIRELGPWLIENLLQY